MPDLLIRNLSPERLKYWKERAAANGRSLQAEIDQLLAGQEQQEERRREFVSWAEAFRRGVGRQTTDSADLIREDRDNDHGRDE